jgi:hypothetical protein
MRAIDRLLRNRPKAGGLSLAGKIKALFSNGEQGWWFDPSNFATLFQDAAGTTPVTAVEQPVGLQLDLSKGLVLGPELVTNGDFTTNLSGWTTSTFTWVAGKAQSPAGDGILEQTVSVTVGKWYEVTAAVTAASGGNTLRLNVFGTTVDVVAGGFTSFKVFAANSLFRVVSFNSPSAYRGSIDNISVKELPGNHRFQTTSANRPVVSARVNLLTKTEQFADAVWGSRSFVTDNFATAPNGTQTAAKINNTTGSENNVAQTVSVTPGTAYTFSFYAKNNGGTTSKYRVFNLTGGADIVAVTSYFPQINGTTWSVINVPFTAPAGCTQAIVYVSAANGATENVLVWGADLRPTNVGVGLPAYQRVNTSTDYDSTGFPTYIKPNGSNQFMVTNSINFSSTDKMTVWQGLRKLSDSGIATFTELSTNGDVSPGIFSFAAPVNSTTYQFALRGTTALSCRQPTTPIFAPVTSVIATNYKLSETAANEITVRFNANAIALSIASSQPGPAGAGNFGNYPAYFYSRAGSTFFSSANDYGSIARGAASTAAQITAGETWINQRTKAY